MYYLVMVLFTGHVNVFKCQFCHTFLSSGKKTSSVLSFFRGASREKSPNRVSSVLEKYSVDSVKYMPKLDQDSAEETGTTKDGVVFVKYCHIHWLMPTKGATKQRQLLSSLQAAQCFDLKFVSGALWGFDLKFLAVATSGECLAIQIVH